jgi:CheY-like chemotaxis protein
MATSPSNHPFDRNHEAAPKQLLVLDADLRVKTASNSFYVAFQTTPSQTLGKRLVALGTGQWDVPALLTLLRELPEVDGEFDDFEMEQDYAARGRRTILVSGRRLPPIDDAQSGMILLSLHDAPRRADREEKKIDETVSLSDLAQSDSAQPELLDPALPGSASAWSSTSEAVDARVAENRVSPPNPPVETSGMWDKMEPLRQSLSGALAKRRYRDDQFARPAGTLWFTDVCRIENEQAAGSKIADILPFSDLPVQIASAEIYLRGRILLVEDGADNQRLLRMQLGGAGASVVSAMNGRTAVDLATAQPFDLVLMDMQMPVMDGYAATLELRRRGHTIPIIALTAYAMPEERAKCIASGCDACLSKPVDEETLLAAVNHYLGKLVPAESAAGVGRPAPAADASHGPGRIRSSLAGDPRMTEIIPRFVDRLPGEVRKMLDLLEHHDLVELQKVIHDLLGTAGGYGFAPVSQPALKARQSIRAGAALEPITAEINSLIGVIRQIEGYDESKVQGGALST